MARTTRRTFLKGSAAAIGAGFAIGGTKASGRVIGANDTISVAVAGLNGRGGAHVGEFAGMDGVQITLPRRPRHPDLRQAAQAGRGPGRQHAEDRPGHPRGARRPGRRRRLDRHAEPLAQPDGHLGLPGRQGRLRREAVQPQHPRGPHRRRGRPRSTTGSSSTAPRAVEPIVGRAGRGRQVGPSTASCSSRGPSATSRAAASASSRPSSPRRSSTSTSGSARRRSSRTTATSSTTTGTGSGTSATATSATRASTRWTSPAG